MSGQAQITSVAALEAFRSDLIVFLSQMHPAVDEVGSEMTRMKFWLQNEQRQFWENQSRQRHRRLEEAQAELFNARLSSLHESSTLQNMAVQKAQRAVHEAEQKLTLLKKWDRDLENLASPLLKPVDQLQGFLAGDMGQAVIYLTQAVQAVEAYMNVLSPGASAATVPATGETKATP